LDAVELSLGLNDAAELDVKRLANIIVHDLHDDQLTQHQP
jgi:hypothetical protein